MHINETMKLKIRGVLGFWAQKPQNPVQIKIKISTSEEILPHDFAGKRGQHNILIIINLFS